jgi:cobyrinic acid a,c-diamide synthase
VTRLPRLVIAAPGSGQGKTTVATGLMAALRARGLRVSGHKVGPDYIDPGYHALATGRPGRNLDPHLHGEHTIVPLLRHGAATPQPADIAIIEGVMGLFDGAIGRAGFASTAHVARLTGTPVVLVVDVSGASRSIAGTVHGFATFDRDITLAGVILNKVGSATHEAEIRDAVAATGVPVLGALRRDTTLDTPSRHLGLIPAAERLTAAQRTVAALGDAVGAGVDLDQLVALARRAPDLTAPVWQPHQHIEAGPAATVAVAGGAAFTFRYPETEELLAAAGLTVATVDPLSDEQLPAGCAGLYLGGGFPEMHAAALAANQPLRSAVAAAAAAGMPIVAECAGLLYLCREIDGQPMAGAIDAAATMTDRLVLGYREASAAAGSLLSDAGTVVTGHEFHRTRVTFAPGYPPAWRLRPRPSVPHGVAATTPDGVIAGRDGSLHAGYLHVHWAGQPHLADRFAHAVAAYACGQPTTGVPSAPRPSPDPVSSPIRTSPPAAMGRVSLVGGGPGHRDLITARGLDRLAHADVIVVDRLAPTELLSDLPHRVQVIDVSKVPRGPATTQQDINQLLVTHARAGRRVVRLKGGDPFLFGRGQEEVEACVAAGVPVEVVPGISSALAVPALAGIPVTHRGLTQGVTIVSGHVPPGHPDSTIDWAAVARSGTTMVLLMAVHTLPAITDALLAHGMAPDTPAVCVENGTTDRQRVLSGDLATIADLARRAQLAPPAVTVIGTVAAFAGDAATAADLNSLTRAQTLAAAGEPGTWAAVVAHLDQPVDARFEAAADAVVSGDLDTP